MDLDRLRGELEDRLEEVIGVFHGDYVERAGIAYLSAKSAKDLGSWQVNLKPRGRYRRGDWYRFSQGVGGNVINLVAYCLTGNPRAYREAIDAAKMFLGGEWRDEVSEAARREREERDRARREAEEKEAELDEARRLELARRIWSEAGPIGGTPAEAYLRSRGLPDLAWPRTVGFHPRLRHATGGTFPALVALCSRPDGSFGGIWRIFIRPDGAGKAPVEPAKMALGYACGAAVRLGPAAGKIAICEGLETGFGAIALGFSRPVWPCLSTSGIITFEPPEGVRDVWILADGDWPRIDPKTGRFMRPPGRVAAEKARVALEPKGIAVAIHEPPVGMDYLDVWNAVKGLDGVGTRRTEG